MRPHCPTGTTPRPFADPIFLPAFSQPPLRLVDLPPSRADRGPQYQQSLAISPRSAGSRTSTSSSVTRRSPMPRRQDTVSTTRSAMVRSTTGITWNVTGSRRSSSTSAPSQRTTTSFWSVYDELSYMYVRVNFLTWPFFLPSCIPARIDRTPAEPPRESRANGRNLLRVVQHPRAIHRRPGRACPCRVLVLESRV